jgi:hypothetical protein
MLKGLTALLAAGAALVGCSSAAASPCTVSPGSHPITLAVTGVQPPPTVKVAVGGVVDLTSSYPPASLYRPKSHDAAVACIAGGPAQGSVYATVVALRPGTTMVETSVRPSGPVNQLFLEATIAVQSS